MSNPKITINVQGKDVTLTLEEARVYYAELAKIFKPAPALYGPPVTIPRPIYDGNPPSHTQTTPMPWENPIWANDEKNTKIRSD